MIMIFLVQVLSAFFLPVDEFLFVLEVLSNLLVICWGEILLYCNVLNHLRLEFSK